MLSSDEQQIGDTGHLNNRLRACVVVLRLQSMGFLMAPGAQYLQRPCNLFRVMYAQTKFGPWHALAAVSPALGAKAIHKTFIQFTYSPSRKKKHGTSLLSWSLKKS